MSFFAWLTRNWADTDQSGDPTIAPLDLPSPPAEALRQVQDAIRALPLWQVEKVIPEEGRINATHRTRLWGFIDDIHIRLEATPTGTRLHARSQSRVGKMDLGQNRRNLLELFAVLRPS